MIKIIIVAMLGVFASVSLKKINSEVSYICIIITGVIIIGMLYYNTNDIISVINVFNKDYGIDDEYIKIFIKVLGISYITQFASSVAEDCGEKSISKKIEFAGRIFIISLSVPIFINLLNTVISLI